MTESGSNKKLFSATGLWQLAKLLQWSSSADISVARKFRQLPQHFVILYKGAKEHTVDRLAIQALARVHPGNAVHFGTIWVLSLALVMLRFPNRLG